MSEQTQKNWLRKHPIWTTLIGIIVLFMLIGIFTPSSEEKQTEQEQVSSQSENKNIGKRVKLNSCELDTSNADYWEGKEVNFWADTKQDSIVFKLSACDDIELEIVDYINENGSELFKINYNGQEGWISKMQLMK